MNVRSFAVTLAILAVAAGAISLIAHRDVFWSDDDRDWRAAEDRKCRQNALPARIEGVRRIFRMPNGHISLFARDTEDPSVFRQYWQGSCRMLFKEDAGNPDAAWVEVIPVTDQPCACDTAIIHLHTLSQIE